MHQEQRSGAPYQHYGQICFKLAPKNWINREKELLSTASSAGRASHTIVVEIPGAGFAKILLLNVAKNDVQKYPRHINV